MVALLKSLGVGACLALATPGQAAGYDRLYVFGDSLVDSGNAQTGAPFFSISDPTPAALGYFHGRFSNGFNFADDLSARLGLGAATAYLQGGTNYAVGGATTATIPPHTLPDPTNDLIPSFGQQIALYEQSLLGGTPPFPASTRPAIDPNSLVLVNFGGNDVRDLLRFGTPAATDAAAALQAGLQRLVADGARNLVVVGLPDIGKLPSVIALGPAAQTAGTALSFGLNNAFSAIAGGVDASLGAAGSVQFFDLFAFQNAAEANPAGFGLDPSLLATSCLAQGAQGTGCAGYLFFDGIHPTGHVHGLIANAIADQIGIAAVPEPGSWIVMILGLGAVGGAMRGERRRSAPGTD